jgi:DNA-binding Lrp family transcriptional regulator
MQRFALHHPYVSHFVETIGSWDFELNVEVESLSQLQEFESDLRREFPNAIHDVTALGVAKVHTLRRFTVHQSD